MAIHKYGNGIRDAAYTAGFGNGEMGQSIKGYSLM